MNILKGEIESVNVNGNLSLVKVKIGATRLTSIVIDTPETAPYLQVNHTVNVIFKETEVILGKGADHQISLQNKLIGTVDTIVSEVQRKKLGTPAIIVIGEVVSLHPELQYEEAITIQSKKDTQNEQ